MKKTIIYLILSAVALHVCAQNEERQSLDERNNPATDVKEKNAKDDTYVPRMYRPVEKPLRRTVVAEQPRMTLEERNAQDIDDGAKDTDHNLLRAALRGWRVSLGAGFEIGGTSPLPLPRSIMFDSNTCLITGKAFAIFHFKLNTVHLSTLSAS